MPPNRGADALGAAARRKSQAANSRAKNAIRALDARGETISFQAVAQTAGVSRQWLYQQPDLRREIEQLRDASGTPGPAVRARERSTEASLRQRIRSLLDENRRLRGESDELRAELGVVYGERRDARRGG